MRPAAGPSGSPSDGPRGEVGGEALGGVSPAVAWAVSAWMGALAGWEVVAADGTVRLDAGVVPGLVVAGMVVGLVVIDVGGRRSRAPDPHPGTHLDTRPNTQHRRVVGSCLLTIAGMLVAAVCLAGLASHRRVALAHGPLVALAATGGDALLTATVVSEPVVRSDGSVWSLVTVTAVDASQGRWRALLSGQQDPLPVGTTLRMRSSARPLDDVEFDGYLRRRHAVVALDPVTSAVVAGPSGMLAVVEQIRERTRSAAQIGLSGDAGGLAVGLVTGDTRLLSESAQDAMQASGLTHLVAVSGSNVALVAAVVAALAGAAPARLRHALVVTAILVFTVTTRAEPSVLRAATMAVVVMTAGLVGRPRSGLHALAVAVIVLLVADPAAAGSLGLVLSVTATLGVLVVAPAIHRRLPPWLPQPVAMLLAATLGAQITVAPVLLAGIGDVPLSAIPANLVAVPAAAVASLVAVVAAVVAQFDLVMGGSLMAVAAPPLHAVLTVAARSGGGPVLTAAAPIGLVMATVVTIGVMAAPRSPMRRLAAGTVLVVVVVGIVMNLDGGWTPPGSLAVTAIDVGQGDALLVTTASGHRMLVDTGRDGRAATWLQDHGIEALDLLVVTHADADHSGGLDDVLTRVDVSTVWVAVRPDGQPEPPWPGNESTLDSPPPADRALPEGSVAVRAGMQAMLGSAVVEVLGPPGGHELVSTEGGRNDRSVIVRVREDDRVALLPGDAEVAAQRWVLGTGVGLETGLLVVPHHGAATSDPAFLHATRTVEAIISVGVGNDYGHPRDEVLEVLDTMGTHVHRTDLDGTVTVVVPAPR